MRAKLIRGHRPDCVMVKYADLNSPPAWYPDEVGYDDWLDLDAAGGKRGKTHKWMQFVCPDRPKCDALCLVEVGSILDDLHALVGVPVLQRESRAVREGVCLPPTAVNRYAEELSTYLFTDGAQRLVLESAHDYFETRPGTRAAGWCREAVRDAIKSRLRAFLGGRDK
jgi:hypothetical protein